MREEERGTGFLTWVDEFHWSKLEREKKRERELSGGLIKKQR